MTQRLLERHAGPSSPGDEQEDIRVVMNAADRLRTGRTIGQCSGARSVVAACSVAAAIGWVSRMCTYSTVPDAVAPAFWTQ